MLTAEATNTSTHGNIVYDCSANVITKARVAIVLAGYSAFNKIMFSNHEKLEKHTPANGIDRKEYIALLVDEYSETTNIGEH